MPKSRMETNQNQLLKSSWKTRRLHLYTFAASATDVTRCKLSAHEDAGVASFFRDDVSRVGQSRLHLRRHLFCRRAHHGNFLPANVHSEKTGARECRFFRNAE